MKTFGDKRNKKNHVSFNLENNHFRNLHLMVYLASLVVVLVAYTSVLLILGRNQFAYMIMLMFSVMIGIFLVFKKDDIVKKMSNELDNRKRIDIKKKDSRNLKKTLLEVGLRTKRTVTERNKNLKLKISGKTSFGDKVNKIKLKFIKIKPEDKKTPDYIEIEE